MSPLSMQSSENFQNNVRRLYNPTKRRWEWWQRCQAGDQEWILSDVNPGRVWLDQFAAPTVFAAAVLGLNSRLPWAVNGRRNGAIAPNDNCFTATNEIGGGLSLNVLIGGQDNDYTAIHWGGNYPLLLRKSPHLKITIAPILTTNVAFLVGLVDDSRSTGTNAFAPPNNFVACYFDTDVDVDEHFVVYSGGVEVFNANNGPPTAGEHFSCTIQTSDDGSSVRVIRAGNILADWLDVSGAAFAALRAAQLQPYFAVVNRAAAQLREFHVHDMRLVMDRGF